MNIANSHEAVAPVRSFPNLGRRLFRKDRISDVALLAIPSLCFVAVLFWLPMIQLLLRSVAFPEWSVANYVAFFTKGAYFAVLIHTVVVGVGVTFCCLILGYPLAYAIHSARGTVKGIMLLLVLMPYLTSLLVRTYAWIVMLGDGGVVNKLLMSTGIIDSPIRILYTSLAAYIGMVHIMLPLMVLPILSVMNGVDPRLVRASKSMGAGPFRSFLQVFLPLTIPGVKSGCVLVFILSIGFYITPAALGGPSDILLSQLIEIQLSQAVNFEFAAAAAFILLVVAGCFIFLFGLDFGAAQTGIAGSGRGRAIKRPVLWRKLDGLELDSAGMQKRRLQRWSAMQYRADPLERVRPLLLYGYSVAALVFLLVPSFIVVLMSFSSDPFLSFPPPGFSLQWYRHFFGDSSWTSALMRSAEIASASTVLSCVVGVLAAYAVSRRPGSGKFVLPVLLSPIIAPVVVVAVALYIGFANWGLLGSKFGLILAHTLGGIGYVVIIMSATLVGFDQRLERAALSMGAGPIRTFAKITLPLISSGIVAGAVFAFIHSFDEVVIATFIGGFGEKTLPMKMWEDIRHQIDPTIAAVSSILLVLPALWLVILQISRKGLRHRDSVKGSAEASSAA